jgi:tetraacyldisaccharide 4'-kinase
MSATFAERHWYRFSVVSALLLPFSLLFRLLVWTRRMLFKHGILVSAAMPVPVIVVGNITVGGTGKTPLVLWMVRALQKLGYRPGVIASGYGGSDRESAEVRSVDDPRVRGDEAVLIAQRSGVPVWSGRSRVESAKGLLRANPDCNVLISDDGLQHYRLRRDVEISVEDERGVGNGCMLPAGPLREPVNREADARVVNSRNAVAPGKFRMNLAPAGFVRLSEPEGPVDLAHFQGKRVHAIAGIGAPERFFQTLRSLGIEATTHVFPDHHDFKQSDLDFEDCDAVMMTEKDAVKCSRIPSSARKNDGVNGAGDAPYSLPGLYALRVEADLDGGFLQFLEKRLNGLKTS